MSNISPIKIAMLFAFENHTFEGTIVQLNNPRMLPTYSSWHRIWFMSMSPKLALV